MSLFRTALLALLLGTPLAASAPPQPPRPVLETGLPFPRTFSPKETGGGTQNWAIVQDPRGVIYVGNNDGVLEFDGVRWRLIRVANKTTVRSLAVDGSGRVYVGALGELGYLEADASGRMGYVSLMERIPPEERGFADVWKTYATQEGIVFSTYSRIFRVGARVEVWKPRTAFHKALRLEDRLFVQEAGRGLLELVDGEWRLLPGGERFTGEKVDVLLPGAGPGALLIGTRTQGLFAFDGAAVRPFPTEVDAGLKRDLYAGVRLGDGTLALGTLQEGLLLLDAHGHLRGNLNKANGLLDDSVQALTQDRQGGLWIALDTGLARAEVGAPVTVFTDRLGLEGGELSVHRHGDTLFAGTGQGLFRLGGSSSASLASGSTLRGRVRQREAGAEGLPRFRQVPGLKGQTWAFLDLGPTLLVANAAGVFELRDGVLRLLRPSGQHSMALFRSRLEPSRVFVGLVDGLASLRFDKGRWVDEGKVPGIREEIRTLCEGADGRLWLGTLTDGFLRLTFPAGRQGGAIAPAPTVERFALTEGLPDLKDNRVYDLGGSPLFATHQGLYRFDEATGHFAPDPRFKTLFPEGPRWVMGIRGDAQGRVWMHAVDEARELRETGAAVPQPDGSYRWQPTPPLRITITDSDLSTWVDPDGVVWFGSPADGLFRYDPSVPKDLQQPFQALVRRVTAPGERLLFGGVGQPPAPSLKYVDNALRFEFAATSFDDLEANRFQVFLEGVDRGWSPWSAEAYRDYTSIREGAYRFRVRAKNAYGTLSQEGVYAFRVLPPWYRTWWALLGYLLATLGTVAGGVRWRLGRAEREKLELEGLVRERTATLEKLNAIVKSINEQLDFDELLHTILEETMVIPGVERAVALVLAPDRTHFVVQAALGWELAELKDIRLTAEEAESHYLREAREVHEDIFVLRGVAGRAAEAKVAHVGLSQAMLVARIRVEGRVEGYLVFDNMTRPEAFEGQDLELLRGLREHFVSAFRNARAMQLEKARAKAEAEAQAKSEFLANMSHEIRTPMNAVIGFAHLGLKLDLEPRPRDYFQKIGNAANSLLGIINDILDFTKIEAGRLELEAIPFRITDVMHQVADLVSPKASEKGVELLVSIAEDVPRSVIGDPLRLGQVLMNLASNAIKFTERGQVLVRVELLQKEARTVLLRFKVKDSGIGMGPEALDRLFQAFTQADTSTTRRFGGTGLGLVISKRLVDLMGGEIEVESEAGKGSTFAFTTLLEIAEAQPEPRRGLRPDLWGLKVLVVDDNATARQVFHEQVRSLGFEVTSVGSGMDALMEVERAEGSHPYDLVLMDWRLQGVDGVETARRIHRNLRLAHVPTILLMTAFGREEAMRNAEQAGIQGFISKPVNPDLLMDAILEAMGRGQEPIPIPKDSDATATAQNLLAGARILLAEDNPINQEVATEILSAAGIRVDVANNGVEAVRKAGAADYDAILMDVQMPEMDGKEATTHIREQPRNKDLPIIAMTAHAMAGYREECLDAGMNDYLSKPIDPQNLFEILSRWIKGRESVPQEPEARSLKAGTLIDSTSAFDVAAGLRRLGGNSAFYLRLVGGFATDFAQADQEIRTALDAGDLVKAEHLAHTLKGVAGNLSAVALAQATAPLEAALRARNAEAARETMPAFEAALAQALAAAPKLAETLEGPPPSTPTLEGRAVEALLQELETRLTQGDPRAEDTWKELSKALPGPACEGPLRELGECLEGFDFKGASATLKNLQEALKKHNEGGF